MKTPEAQEWAAIEQFLMTRDPSNVEIATLLAEGLEIDLASALDLPEWAAQGYGIKEMFVGEQRATLEFGRAPQLPRYMRHLKALHLRGNLGGYRHRAVRLPEDLLAAAEGLESLSIAGLKVLKLGAKFFAPLKNLKTLSLRGTFCALLPRQFAGLPHLERLAIRQAQLNWDDSTAADLQNLRTLTLRDCRIDVETFVVIGKLQRLRRLELRGCYMAQPPRECFAKLRKLRYFELHDSLNIVHQPMKTQFGLLQRVKHLAIQNSRRPELYMEDDFFGGTPNILTLELDDLHLVVAPKAQPFKSLHKIDFLHLSSQSFKAELDYPVFAGLSSLRVLSVPFGKEPINILSPRAFEGLDKIFILSLSTCKGMDFCDRAFERLPAGITLTISKQGYTSPCFVWREGIFEGLKAKHLSLGDNMGLGDFDLGMLRHCENLVELNLNPGYQKTSLSASVDFPKLLRFDLHKSGDIEEFKESIKVVARMPNLTYINFIGPPVFDAGVLAALGPLRFTELCFIARIFLDFNLLSQFTQLRKLTLSSISENNIENILAATKAPQIQTIAISHYNLQSCPGLRAALQRWAPNASIRI